MKDQHILLTYFKFLFFLMSSSELKKARNKRVYAVEYNFVYRVCYARAIHTKCTHTNTHTRGRTCTHHREGVHEL